MDQHPAPHATSGKALFAALALAAAFTATAATAWEAPPARPESIRTTPLLPTTPQRNVAAVCDRRILPAAGGHRPTRPGRFPSRRPGAGILSGHNGTTTWAPNTGVEKPAIYEEVKNDPFREMGFNPEDYESTAPQAMRAYEDVPVTMDSNTPTMSINTTILTGNYDTSTPELESMYIPTITNTS